MYILYKLTLRNGKEFFSVGIQDSPRKRSSTTSTVLDQFKSFEIFSQDETYFFDKRNMLVYNEFSFKSEEEIIRFEKFEDLEELYI